MIGLSTIWRAGIAASGLSLMAMALPVTAAAPGHEQLNEIARCAVAKDRGAAASAVRHLPLTGDAVTIVPSALGDGAGCASAAPFEGPAVLIRGAMAQAFYFADFRELGMEPRVPARSFADLGWPEESGTTAAEAALLKFGECLARNDGDNADKLMRAGYGTAQAKKILDLMQAYYAVCYPSGTNLTLGRDTLHAAIAQGAYHSASRYWNGQLTFVKKNGR